MATLQGPYNETPEEDPTRSPAERPSPVDEHAIVDALEGSSRRVIFYLVAVVLLLSGSLIWSYVAFSRQGSFVAGLSGDLLKPLAVVQSGDVGANLGASVDGTGPEVRIIGPDAADGAQAAVGTTVIGEPGEPGPPGREGPEGREGADGVQGARGLTGATGVAGDDGEDGSDGAAGPSGPPGPAGPAGPAGIGSVGAGGGLSDSGTPTDPVIDINDSATNGLTLVGDTLTVAAGDGLSLSGDTVAAVAADATISVGAGGISVGVIGDSNVAFGVGAGTVSADDIPLADTGGFYATDNVEAALAQIQGADITAVGTAVGSGLSGGATSGSASLSLITSCGSDEILKWTGAAWVCAPDEDSGGTVTSLTAGDGVSDSGTAADPVLDVNDSATNGLVITADVLGINDDATNGLTIAGDVLTVATGSGVGLSGNNVVAVAANSTITVGVGGISVGIIGDTNISFGTGAGQVSAADIPIADTGAYYTTDDVESALAQVQGADIVSVGTAAGTGLEGGASSGAASLSLTTVCGPSEILKWTGAVWSCSPDANSGGTVTSVSAGAGVTNSGTAADPTIDVGAGSGITVGANDIALGPLTADWNQTGAFDINLNNAGSELRILESAGATFFGSLDVGDLAADAVYTLSGGTATILTDANYASTLDPTYVNVGESPAAGDIAGSFSGGLTVNANSVALGTDTTNDYVASFTAGAGLTGSAAGEGSTPTIDVVSANGGIVVNAADIALTPAPSANGLSSTTSSGSGLEVLASGVALLQGCADTEVLKWDESADEWACSADADGTASLQTAYSAGATITTASSTPIAFALASGDFNVSGAGGVNLTPTAASQFTSGGALTFTAGAASTWATSSGALTLTSAAGATWSTSAGALTVRGSSGLTLDSSTGNVTLQPAGSGTTANVQIGAGGTGSATPDLLGLDVKSVASGSSDPTGFAGATYYNLASEKFRCYENGAWKDCDTTAAGSPTTLETAYDNDAAGSDVVIDLTTADDSIIVQNPAASGTDSAFLLGIDQLAGSSTTGLLVTSAASGMTTALDVTDTDIVNAISIGDNTILGTNGVINFTNFDVASTGALTFSGVGTDITTDVNEDLTLAPNGTGEVVIGASDTTGTQLVLDVKTDAGDPTGIDGGMYYSTNSDKFRCFENGAWGDCGTSTRYVTADVANSTTTFADVTGLTFPVTSGFTYQFTCELTYTTAATTTALQLSVNGPATSALDYSVRTSTTATAMHSAAQTAYDTVTNPATGGGSTRLPVRIVGSLIPSASGTLAVRSRSEINTSAATVKRGSFCTFTKI